MAEDSHNAADPFAPPAMLGIDVGGTFTDFILFDGSGLSTFKSPTTPGDLLEGIGAGMEALSPSAGYNVIQGSTIATNALLERKGWRVALVTTRGFRDMLRIRRQDRPNLYEFAVRLPEPVVQPDDCYEVTERLDAAGRVITALDEDDARQVVQHIVETGVDTVAVCFLFSFLNGDHEAHFARLAREAGLRVFCSTDVLPEFREFERASTTVINAYVAPLMSAYLERLNTDVRAAGAKWLRVMQSNGGQIDTDLASRQAVRTVLSGPAGGVVAAAHVARLAGIENVIAYDMGGTSTDVSLIRREPLITTESVVDGWPIRVPMLAIHTVGAGGGSIARIDEGGALVVGPESAGAHPGPACYGHDDQPTVTDAHVALGRIQPKHFLGGRMTIAADRSLAVMARLADAMQCPPPQAALGVIRVANANMERAIKGISAEQGHDPRDFWLLSFGGAGGLHAVALADALGMKGVIVPPHPGILSAVGMILADLVLDYARSIPTDGDMIDMNRLRETFAELMERAAADVQLQGYEQDDSLLERQIDARYRGQSYELTVSADSLTDPDRLIEPFHRAHEQRFGHRVDDRPVEITTLRLRAIINTPKPALETLPAARDGVDVARLETVEVHFDQSVATPVYDRDRLAAGHRLSGPAIVIEPHATTLVPPNHVLEVHPRGHLTIAASKGPSR